MTPPSKRNVKIKVGGAVIRVPSKAVPKKVGRPRKKYPEHAPTHKPNFLPPDPWNTTGHSNDQLITVFEGKRFYKEELSEEFVEAKIAEYRAGKVPKLITYHDPEEETDAYASLMQQSVNRPTLRSIRNLEDLGFRRNNASRRPVWDSQAKTSVWLWDHNSRNEGAPFNYKENDDGDRSPRKRSSGSSPRDSARKVSRQSSSRTKPRARKGS